ncbi:MULTISPECIES: DUF507 family protein [Chloroflexus]|uniref:DUF507 domain-containing protein n=1 Tax=Chloroflexus aggregans (strain MD-66 / DSM 9485) TaxID=326427 RepID=B8G8X2_CHLAD|nr:DUF507 family protein [Chloroflexus aggregans]ACL26247.1 conserved hypothetical protein [Chloroflexus aggregans DSM 9485]
MKLSPAKVDQLATMLVDVLAETDGVLFQTSDPELRAAIREIMIDELEVEDRLNAEVHQMLQAYKYEITHGRLDYDTLFRRLRQRLIAERKIVL